jgi:hypothetical protein
LAFGKPNNRPATFATFIYLDIYILIYTTETIKKKLKKKLSKKKQILAQQPFLVRAFPFGISRQKKLSGIVTKGLC